MPTPEEYAARVWQMAGDPDRHYQPQDIGPICRRCLTGIPKAIDQTTHPTCFKRDEPLMMMERNRLRA